MRRRLLWLVGPLGLALVAGGWIAWRSRSEEQAVVATITAFYQALGERRWEDAGALATSSIAQRLRRETVRSQPQAAAPPTVRIDRLVVSGPLASAGVRVETQLAGGRWDVLWHRLELMKKEGTWRLTRVEAAAPEVVGAGGRIPADFDPAAFGRYLDALGAGDWEAAAAELAGPARSAHDATRWVLGKPGAGLFRTHTAPRYTPLWADRDGKTVIASASYAVDGRSVAMQVTFYRTGGGWRVVDVLDVTG